MQDGRFLLNGRTVMLGIADDGDVGAKVADRLVDRCTEIIPCGVVRKSVRSKSEPSFADDFTPDLGSRGSLMANAACPTAARPRRDRRRRSRRAGTRADRLVELRRLDQAVEDRRDLRAATRLRSVVIPSADDRAAYPALGRVVVQWDPWIIDESREPIPVGDHVARGVADRQGLERGLLHSQVLYSASTATDSVRRSSARRMRSPSARASISYNAPIHFIA